MINFYNENEKPEYTRDWIKKLGDIGSYIVELESNIQQIYDDSKIVLEKRLQKLKLYKTNYFFFKGQEEDSKRNFLRAAKLYVAFIKDLNSTEAAV